MATYTLYTAIDHKSQWTARTGSSDYKIVERMRNHYKSKNYLTKIVKEDD
jgi:hypothetical protein